MEGRVTFHLDKLVRDKLPDMMREMGQEPEVIQLQGDAHIQALIAKVAEELAELDPSSPSFATELSQVKQAVKDLIDISVGDEEIERLRLEDVEKRGGFKEGLYISTLHLQPDDEWVEYYRQEPEKHREEGRSMKIEIKKLRENAVLPDYQTASAAGMDLTACLDEPVILQPHERFAVPLGFAIALPVGYEAQVRGRSGMAAKFGIVPANGVGTVDADYRGEVHAILLNTSNQPFTIEPGMRVAQMVINRYEVASWSEVAELDETERGEGRFGSTGH
jgi:dUTP pyrophosphatase